MYPKSIQNAFFASMTDPQAFRLMFDQQPNVFFFVKDRESQLIAANLPRYSRLSPQRVLLIRGQACRMGLTPAVPADDEHVRVGPVARLRCCKTLTNPRQLMAWFCMRKPRQEWNTLGR